MDSLNVRGSQFSRHGDIMNDYLESSDSESETSMLHNDLPGRGAQANHINGETKTWTQVSKISGNTEQTQAQSIICLKDPDQVDMNTRFFYQHR